MNHAGRKSGQRKPSSGGRHFSTQGWVTPSLALAGVLNSALLHAGLSVTLGRTALPEVDSMTCPAIAVEVAPNKPADGSAATDLDDPAYQARVAEALAAALLEWKTEVQQP